MKFIAISLIVLAGAIMAAAGTLAESMPAVKRWSIVDDCGLGVVAVGIVLFVMQLQSKVE